MPTVEANQLILINKEGYPTADVTIKYGILPSDYPYLYQDLYAEFYEKDATGSETLMGFIQADKDGRLILTQGTAKFKTENAYYAELVLHRGQELS